MPFLDVAFEPRTADFFNFTALPDSAPPALLYASGGPGKAGLTAETVELRPMAFEISFAGGERSGVLSARDALGREVWSTELRQARQALVDLRAKPAGRYSLSLGTEPLAQIYADDSLSRRPPLGVIGIETSRLAAAAREPASTPLNFVLPFAARATLWRYNVVGVSASEAGTLEVVDTAGGVCQTGSDLIFNDSSFYSVPDGVRKDDRFRFSWGGTRTLPDGRTAQLFQSAADRPIPMRAEPGYRFSLVRRSKGEHKVLIPRLPYPPLILTGTSGGHFISDVYVANPLRGDAETS